MVLDQAAHRGAEGGVVHDVVDVLLVLQTDHPQVPARVLRSGRRLPPRRPQGAAGLRRRPVLRGTFRQRSRLALAGGHPTGRAARHGSAEQLQQAGGPVGDGAVDAPLEGALQRAAAVGGIDEDLPAGGLRGLNQLSRKIRRVVVRRHHVDVASRRIGEVLACCLASATGGEELRPQRRLEPLHGLQAGGEERLHGHLGEVDAARAQRTNQRRCHRDTGRVEVRLTRDVLDLDGQLRRSGPAADGEQLLDCRDLNSLAPQRVWRRDRAHGLRRSGAPPVSGVALSDLHERLVEHRADAIGRAVQRVVVQHHEVPVGGQLDIGLELIDPEADGVLECRQGVLRRVRGSAAVSADDDVSARCGHRGRGPRQH